MEFLILLLSLAHKEGPRYLRLCLPYVTDLNLGITKSEFFEVIAMCVFSQKGPEYMVDDRAMASLHLSKLRPEESTSRAINFSQYTQWIEGSAVMIPVLFLQ